MKNIRLKIGNVIMRHRVSRSKNNTLYSNFNVVRKIGIVWDASKTEEFSILSRFCQKMNNRNIEVKILGFFPGKQLPDQYTAVRYLTCIRENEINFFYYPVSPESHSFISDRFDVLIDINFEKIFPLSYISSLSNAGIKVGLFDSETIDEPFTLMIDMKKPVDVDSYLIQVIQYLEMINSGTA